MNTNEEILAWHKKRTESPKCTSDQEILVVIGEELIKMNECLSSIHDKYVRNIK